jgi:hypothetical protein
MHFDNVKERDLREAFSEADLPHASLTVKGEHSSRSHRTAFEVRLTGDGTQNRRRTQDNEDFAATYDEWGAFISRLYDRDVTAKIGPYESRADFHQRTCNRYER